jgi:hypothetical protein
MRLAVAVVTSLLLAVGVEVTPANLSDTVSVAVTTAAAREAPGTRSNFVLLWNRNIRTTPIGHGVEACVKVGRRGGFLGASLLSCDLTLVLPLGKVTATGIVHGFRRYTLVITGGTGAYLTAQGPLFVRSVTGDGVRRLTFQL